MQHAKSRSLKVASSSPTLVVRPSPYVAAAAAAAAAAARSPEANAARPPAPALQFQLQAQGSRLKALLGSRLSLVRPTAQEDHHHHHHHHSLRSSPRHIDTWSTVQSPRHTSTYLDTSDHLILHYPPTYLDPSSSLSSIFCTARRVEQHSRQFWLRNPHVPTASI
ncbi:hypothetical protein K504DRAFT_504160 [Pleomassaria siparia CBS 279.74]|uniref:Uncharacterized protein n=1 Tax=Pleomassaria siparia CBS 279.74 TaxID=1314801 RepID=A0A6G1K509_9PLEO|nr:hypothetical protein K504DRAFT_504160 [Pleomassaria siparia CBS 279.74]